MRVAARGRWICAWANYRPRYRVFDMKITLNIDDAVMAGLKQEAARQGRTMSDLVETALHRLFKSQTMLAPLTPLPSFKSGGALVDVADRNALF